MAKWISILLALTGLAAALWAVRASTRQAPYVEPARPPAVNPYPDGFAATGVVEAASRNIRIAAPEAGVVQRVLVQVNDRVQAGDVLLQLDPRLLEADLGRAQAAVEVARQQVARLEALPRQEDLPPLRAGVARAEAQLADARTERDRVEKLRGQDAASEIEWTKRNLAVDVAQATLDEARAALDRLKAGAWQADLAVARANLRLTEAEAQAIQQRLDRLRVRSPIAGLVLKRLVEPGEFLPPTSPALLVGDTSSLRVRAQVDERDTQSLRLGAPATAVFIGRRQIPYPLRMLAIEPLALPKSQLSGQNTELVDTRVVEAVFEVLPGSQEARLYPGQVVDVFIDVATGPPAAASATSRPAQLSEQRAGEPAPGTGP